MQLFGKNATNGYTYNGDEQNWKVNAYHWKSQRIEPSSFQLTANMVNLYISRRISIMPKAPITMRYFFYLPNKCMFPVFIKGNNN